MILLLALLFAGNAWAASYTFDCQGTATASSDGTHIVCTPGTTPPNPNPTPPEGLSNCSNQGIYILGNAPVAMTWQGSQTFFSSTLGAFGNSTAWLFTMAVPANAVPGTYKRISVSEYGGNAYMRTIVVSLLPCDMRTTVDVTGVNGPVLAAGGTTASVYYGSNGSAAPVYPYVMVPGKTYYISVINHFWQGDWSCSSGNCQAILNLQ